MPAYAYAVTAPPSSGLDRQQRIQVINQNYGFPPGLANQFAMSVDTFASRFWIVDNSGSMSTADGHSLIPLPKGGYRSVGCSRWDELGSAVCWHAQLASRLRAPTQFRLLNPPGSGAHQVLDVGYGNEAVEVQAVQQSMSQSPNGGTPLCAHLRAVYDAVLANANQYRAEGKRALLVLATDGESSDGDVAQALRAFRNLPVWVVIRLCTDQDNIVEYWNNIDNELELDMDVLDDVKSEAEQVTELNPWLNYCIPLHRLREWGTCCKEFDLLDERGFRPLEVKSFLENVMGTGSLPHPDVDYNAFEAAIVDFQTNRVPLEWDPITGRMMPWVKTARLRRSLGKGGGCAMM